MVFFDANIFPPQKGVYLVGGSLRDVILGRKPLDYDFAVKGDSLAFARRIARQRNGRLVIMGKPGQQIFRVVFQDTLWDISPLKGGSIEEDLAGRDFSINALAFDTASRKLIDIRNGLSDLNQGRIRMVSEHVFQKDPLRLLRAFRLAASLGFQVDAATEARIQQDAALIHRAAAERIREELLKTLAAPQSFSVVHRVHATGLLFQLFPELAALTACGPGRHHELDGLAHTLKALEALETLAQDGGVRSPASAELLSRVQAAGGNPLLKCALLLHDIGKPACASRDDSGHVHYYGHEKTGSVMTREIGERLRFSKAEIETVGFMVRRHLDPLQLFVARRTGSLTQRGIARFFMRCGDRTADLLLHAIADTQAKKMAPLDRDVADFIGFAGELFHLFRHRYLPTLSAPPLLTGNDLIHDLHLRPSPYFKAILSRVEEGRLSGRIATRDDALKLAKQMAAGNRRRP